MPRSEPLSPEVFAVTLSSGDTEYSQALSIGTKQFSMQCRTAFDVRHAYASGLVATPTDPFMTMKSGNWYNSPEKFGAIPWDQQGVAAVAEVDTITVADTWAEDDTVVITIHGRPLTVTVGTLVTPAQVATTVTQAWNGETLTDTSASVAPTGGGAVLIDHSQLLATVSGSVVTLTAVNAGARWNTATGGTAVVVTPTTAGDGDATLANGTPAAGPAPIIYLASAEAGVVVEIKAYKTDIRG